MIRVLFVDDEAQVLDGLRNVLRKQRKVWEMAFALGGQAALDECARAPFDVVVSDMRMPGMDGPELLRQIRERYPSTIRIVLSGQAERAAIVRALPVAHQYLSKPCETPRLISVVDRTMSLQALLGDAHVRALVAGLDKLPSVPSAYLAITEAALRPETTLEDVVSIVERDPPLVAKILQVVNSAYFGLRQHVVSIRQAVRYIGVDLIKSLALTGHLFGTASIPARAGFSFDELQAHSLLTSRLAKRMMEERPNAEDVFTAAIVHDIGEIVLATGLPERFAETRRAAQRDRRPAYEVELEVFGTSHAEVGAYLLGMWGLPFSIVEATAFHHRPGLVAAGERSVLAAVHLADILVEAEASNMPDAVVVERIDLGLMAETGLLAELDKWRDFARAEIATAVS